MAIADIESKSLGFLFSITDDSLAVSFSGGKDSLVALDLAYRAGIRKVVFCDTSIEYDETIEYVHQVEQFYDIDIEIIQPQQSFFSMIEKVTAPSRRQRWCCEVLKFGPLGAWGVKNNVEGYITGLRRDESVSRSEYSEIDMNPLLPIKQINPILEWTEQEVWDYIEMYNLPVNPLYKYFTRTGCWCCPFKSKSEWEILEKHYPEKKRFLDQKIEELANRLRIKDKKTFVSDRGWTYWIHSTRKINIGVNTICNGGNESIVVLATDDKELIQRITDLLPILTTNFRAIGNKIRIKIEKTSKKRLQILLERALNCVGCGACLAFCKYGALEIKNNHLVVNTNLCTNCHVCLASNILKGSCISRHYRPKRLSLVQA